MACVRLVGLMEAPKVVPKPIAVTLGFIRKDCTALSYVQDVSGWIFVNGFRSCSREGAGGGTLALGMSWRGCINAGCWQHQKLPSTQDWNSGGDHAVRTAWWVGMYALSNTDELVKSNFLFLCQQGGNANPDAWLLRTLPIRRAFALWHSHVSAIAHNA